MGWKNWPYWLKGGIIGLFIQFIGFICFFMNDFGYSQLWKTETILIYPFMFVINGVSYYYEPPVISMLLAFFINSACYFILGALAGLIYGKIKKK